MKASFWRPGFEVSTQYNSLHGLTITDTVDGFMNNAN